MFHLDSENRLENTFVAIDATIFWGNDLSRQLAWGNLERELNKAFIGFNCNLGTDFDISQIITGNWGCGAFRGCP